MAKYDFRRALESLNSPLQLVARADNALRNLEKEWYRTDHTAAEDAARFILANAAKILMTGNTGRKTLNLLERFAEGVLNGTLNDYLVGSLPPMEAGMFAAYNA